MAAVIREPGHIRAVVFDLYGTLVPSPTVCSYRHRLAAGTAERLGVPFDRFWPVYEADYRDRQLGKSPNLEASLRRLARKLDVDPPEAAIRDAATHRLGVISGYLQPRERALDVLHELKSHGYRLGLITDCSWETVALWKATPLAEFIEAPVFSVETGLTKPDPKIYHIACERLDVLAREVLFVGDGGSDELAGAEAVGMKTILLQVPDERSGAHHRPGELRWGGPTIEDLAELPEVIRAGP